MTKSHSFPTMLGANLYIGLLTILLFHCNELKYKENFERNWCTDFFLSPFVCYMLLTRRGVGQNPSS